MSVDNALFDSIWDFLNFHKIVVKKTSLYTLIDKENLYNQGLFIVENSRGLFLKNKLELTTDDNICDVSRVPTIIFDNYKPAKRKPPKLESISGARAAYKKLLDQAQGILHDEFTNAK